MIKNFRFKDIEILLKKNSSAGEEIIEAFEKLTDAAIIFTPSILGPQWLPLLELLDTKDRLFNLGKRYISFLRIKLMGTISRDFVFWKQDMLLYRLIFCFVFLTAYQILF